MKSDIQQRADKVITSTYSRFPVVLTQGTGCELYDETGKKYIDFLAGIAVCNLGHAHPRIREAIRKQSDRLFHVSNLFYTIPQVELAEKLVQQSFADRVFFCNSGAEANEAAIKLARKYFQDKGETRRFRIISMKQSFHGRTMGTLSATGQDKIRAGFEPVLDGFHFVPFNDVSALEKAITPDICAVMLEPVQGEGGVRCPGENYLQQVRKICDEAGILLIFDEIQTGIGRTGKLFAYEHFNVTPDIMSLAKALGNGLPIGAMLATEEAAKAFSPGAHASTFGGTPVITAAALEVLKVIEEEKLVEACRKTGIYFKEALLRLKEKHSVIQDVRGMGLLLGMELSVPGRPIVDRCLENGFIINCIQDKVLRFVPPLIITKEQIDLLMECIDNIFDNMQ
ncbi:MAG: acetylornithine transaminase [Desulfobacteraceae bacterium]|nr:MAG: acetylornithine transaminase [Desulfobacteraceae bacterium]